MVNNVGLPGLVLLSLLFGITTASANILDFDFNRTIDRLANNVFKYSISSARAFSEITYEDVRYDPNLETFLISGLSLRPYDLTPRNDCQIFIGSISIFGDQDYYSLNDKFSIGIGNVEVNEFCFPDDFRTSMKMFGTERLNIPQLDVEIEHNYQSAATKIKIYGGVADLADVNIVADFDYFSVTANEYFPIAAKLSGLELNFYNKGLWENAKQQLPPSFVNPDFLSLMIEEMVAPTATSILGIQLAEEFVSQTNTAAIAFLQNPSGLRIKTEISEGFPVNIDEELFSDPAQVYGKLKPRITTTNDAKSPVDMSDVYTLIATKNFQNFELNEVAAIAMGLETGLGVPKNESLAVQLYEIIISQGYTSYYKNLINLKVRNSEFSQAYLDALSWAQSGDKLAASYLNKIEKNIELGEIIQLQTKSLLQGDEAMPSETAPFDKAMAYLKGDGALKSYEKAYYWSIFAMAAGDQRASFLVDRLERLSEKLEGDDRSKWSSLLVKTRLEAGRDFLNPN